MSKAMFACIPKGLFEIGERLRTQDNRMTKYPIFCVQEKRRQYGFLPQWGYGIVWIDISTGQEVDENDPHFDPDSPDIQQVGYKDEWHTVMAAFTEEGCKRHLELNRHNYRGEVRIYVDHLKRNPEMVAIREWLMTLVEFEP